MTEWLSSAEKAYACPETYYWAIEDKASRAVIAKYMWMISAAVTVGVN